MKPLLVAVLLAAGCAPALPVPPSSPAPATEAPRALRLVPVRGTVEARLPGGTWESVAAPRGLPEGAELRTQADAVAELRFPDGSVARLAAETQLTVHDYPRTRAEADTDLALSRGEVWSTVLRLGGSGTYQVRTETGIAMVRGTSFDVEYRDGRTRVVVAVHAVEFLTGGRTVPVLAGRALLAREDGVEELPAADLLEQAWFEENLEADAAYLEELAEEEVIDAYYGEDVDATLEAVEEEYEQGVETYDEEVGELPPTDETADDAPPAEETPDEAPPTEEAPPPAGEDVPDEQAPQEASPAEAPFVEDAPADEGLET